MIDHASGAEVSQLHDETCDALDFRTRYLDWQNQLILRPSNCRGRDDHCWSPPAQIRTCAFTHTALTEDEWSRSACQDRDAEREGAESTGSTVG